MRICTFAFLFGCLAPTLSGHCQTIAKAEITADMIIQQPPSTPISEWKDEGIRKTINLRTEGMTLRGFRYAGADPKAPEVLFLNGNGMSVLHTDRFYRALAALGPSVTVYDYRGFGFSEGTPSLSKFRVDGLRAYDDLVKSASGGRVIVYGASMGTAIAAFIASQRSLTGLVLGMPIASAEEEIPVYGQLIGFSAAQLASTAPSTDASDIFGEATLIKRSTAPLLVLGGANDTIVPVNQAHEVFAASPAVNKKIVVVPGAGHNEVILSPLAILSVRTFLNALR